MGYKRFRTTEIIIDDKVKFVMKSTDAKKYGQCYWKWVSNFIQVTYLNDVYIGVGEYIGKLTNDTLLVKVKDVIFESNYVELDYKQNIGSEE